MGESRIAWPSGVSEKYGVDLRRNLTALKALCAAQKNPFHELCIDDGDLGLSRKRLREPEVLEINGSYVY